MQGLVTLCCLRSRLKIVLTAIRFVYLAYFAFQTLAAFIEMSPNIRSIDLRDNCISPEGLKILFDATRRNPSVLYVTKVQSGLMIEGFRELAARYFLSSFFALNHSSRVILLGQC